MRYEHIWRKTLNENEKVEYEFSVAKKQRILVLVIWAIIGVVFLFSFPSAGVLFVVLGLIHYWYLGLNAYALTNKRLLVHTGWLSTKSTTINYDKIIEISVDEPFLNRTITNSGNLVIKTGGFGHDVILTNIESPYEVKKRLDRLSHHE